MFEEQSLGLKKDNSLCSKRDNPCVRRRTIPCVRRRTILVFEKGQSLCSKKDIPCVRRRTFLVFDGRHSSCSKKDIRCVRRRTLLVFEDDETPIFGRTDLRKGVSEAKFDAEADFDVKKCPAPPKSPENHEILKKNPKNFPKVNFRRQKSESCKSSETRFPEVSRRSDRSSRANGILMWCRIKSRKQMARRQVETVAAAMKIEKRGG